MTSPARKTSTPTPAGGTLLVSVRNDPDLELGPPPPTLTKTEPGSPGESTEPRVIGQAAFGATIKIYTNSECSEVPAATGTATELASPGIAHRRPRLDDRLLGDRGIRRIVSPCSSSSVTYTQEEAVPPPPPLRRRLLPAAPPPGKKNPKKKSIRAAKKPKAARKRAAPTAPSPT